MNKLIVGEKYVPIKKTSVFIGLESSVEWRKAQEKEQGYLYYNGTKRDGSFKGVHLFSCVNGGYGDFFNPDDVIPYVEETKDVTKLIVGEKYVPLKKSVGIIKGECASVKEMKDLGNEYLYYLGMNESFGYHRFGPINDIDSMYVDWYLPEDVIPYVEPPTVEEVAEPAKTTKLIIGNKYVPIKKTVGDPIERSGNWKNAKEKGQKYLYYNGIWDSPDLGKVHIFGDNLKISGDYYSEDDVVPYAERFEKIDRIEVVYK